MDVHDVFRCVHHQRANASHLALYGAGRTQYRQRDPEEDTLVIVLLRMPRQTVDGHTLPSHKRRHQYTTSYTHTPVHAPHSALVRAQEHHRLWCDSILQPACHVHSCHSCMPSRRPHACPSLPQSAFVLAWLAWYLLDWRIGRLLPSYLPSRARLLPARLPACPPARLPGLIPPLCTGGFGGDRGRKANAHGLAHGHHG